MKKELIKQYKEELNWLEKTPWYIGSDGMPNIALIIGLVLTGIIPILIIILLYRHYRKEYLKKQLGMKK